MADQSVQGAKPARKRAAAKKTTTAKTAAKETMMNATNFEHYAADAQKAFAEQTQQFTARVDDMAEFAKGNVDAVFASAAKAAESMTEITTEMLSFAKYSVDANFAAVRELSQVKDPSEFVERQQALAKVSVETLAQQAKKLNEMGMAAAKECAEPMSARLAAVGEMVKSGSYKG